MSSGRRDLITTECLLKTADPSETRSYQSVPGYLGYLVARFLKTVEKRLVDRQEKRGLLWFVGRNGCCFVSLDVLMFILDDDDDYSDNYYDVDEKVDDKNDNVVDAVRFDDAGDDVDMILTFMINDCVVIIPEPPIRS